MQLRFICKIDGYNIVMINHPVVPQTYEQWRRCITVDCRINLTREYIESRLVALDDAESIENRNFRRLYGDGHFAAVRQWFRQALKDNRQESQARQWSGALDRTADAAVQS